VKTISSAQLLVVEDTLMGVTKVRLVIIGVCPFIRDKSDRHKSEVCNLQDGSQLYANK